MPNEEVKLRITVEEMAELDKLRKKIDENAYSLNELARAKKLSNKEMRETPFQTERWTQLAAEQAKFNDIQRDVRIETKAGHEAYFRAGLELRQLALAGLGANTVIGKFSNTAGNAVLNAVQLKQALIPLGVSMGGVGIAGVALGSMLVEMAPQIWELITAASEAEKAFKKWSDKVIETHDNIYELITVQESLARKFIETSKAYQYQTVMGGFLARLLFGDPDKAAAELDKARVALNKFFEKDLATQAEEGFKRTADAEAALYMQWMDDLEAIGLEYERLGWLRLRSMGKVAEGGIPQITKPSELKAIGITRVAEGPKPMLEDTFQFGAEQARTFTQQMAAGFANSTGILAQGFVRAFGLGQSLLDQFAASLLATLAQAGLNFLTGGLLGLIGLQHGGMIPEPVVGMGRSGRVYAFGEAGPEYVTPTSSNAIAFGSLQRQMGAMTDAVVSREWRLKGIDMVLAHDRASKVLRDRRM